MAQLKCSSPKSSFICCQILCERKWGLDKKRIRPNMKRLDFLNTPRKKTLQKRFVFNTSHGMRHGFLLHYLSFTSLPFSAPFPRLHICLKYTFTQKITIQREKNRTNPLDFFLLKIRLSCEIRSNILLDSEGDGAVTICVSVWIEICLA